MMYKTAVGSFQVGAAFSAPAANIAYFSTLDKGTARLEFRIQDEQGQPLPLSGVKPKLALQMGDKSTFIHDNVEILDPIEGILEYVLSDDEIKHYGQASGELYLVYDDSRQASVHKFSFKIERALIDESVDVIQEYYVKDFELFKKALEDKLAATNAAIDEAKAEIADTVQTATTNVNNTAAAATKSINDTATAAKNSVTTTANTAKTDVTNTANSAKTSITSTKTAAETSIAAAVEEGESSLATAAATAKTDVTNTANSAKSSITSTKTAAETSIAAAVEEGESSLATAAATAKTDVTNTANSAKSSITSTKTSAESSINTTKTQATTAINDLVTSAQGSIKTVSDQVATAQTNINEILAAIRNNQLLKKTGDTMTGPLNFNVTDPTPINVKRTGNASNANIKVEHDGASGFIGIDRSGLWKIITGTDPNLDGAAAAKFLETTEGAQNRVNTHANKKDNPHGVTAEQVTSIPAKAGTANANTYPVGVTTFPVTDLDGYPSKYGTVITTRYNNSRGGQVFFDKEGPVSTRTIHEAGTNGWTAWVQQETTAGSQSKADAIKLWSKSLGFSEASSFLDTGTDLNKLFKSGMYYASFINYPGDGSPYGYLISQMQKEDQQHGQQFFRSHNSDRVFTRRLSYGAWQPWKEFAFLDDLTWYDLPLVNGAQIYSAAEKPMYAIDGKTVWLKGAVKGVTGPLFTVATLPVGFRPRNQDHTFAQSTSFDGYKATVVRWKLETATGNLYVHRNSMDSYDAGQWYPIATSFRIDN